MGDAQVMCKQGASVHCLPVGLISAQSFGEAGPSISYPQDHVREMVFYEQHIVIR